jgi:hypothetical protein
MDRYNLAGDGWRTCPGEAFREHVGESERGYPGDRHRADDTRASSDPRFAHPESFAATVGPAATTLDFIRFSGVPDFVILDPGLQPATFTFRDDAGRIVGTANLSITSPGPVPVRCRSVDVTVPGATATVVSVTGYYEPHHRLPHSLVNDYDENEQENLHAGLLTSDAARPRQ